MQRKRKSTGAGRKSSSARPLADFLAKVHDDSKLHRQIMTNFDATIKSSGLSAKHKRVLLTRDPKKILHSLVDEHIEAHPRGPVSALAANLSWIVIG